MTAFESHHTFPKAKEKAVSLVRVQPLLTNENITFSTTNLPAWIEEVPRPVCIWLEQHPSGTIWL
jgi:hypothetical protein